MKIPHAKKYKKKFSHTEKYNTKTPYATQEYYTHKKYNTEFHGRKIQHRIPHAEKYNMISHMWKI